MIGQCSVCGEGRSECPECGASLPEEKPPAPAAPVCTRCGGPVPTDEDHHCPEQGPRCTRCGKHAAVSRGLCGACFTALHQHINEHLDAPAPVARVWMCPKCGMPDQSGHGSDRCQWNTVGGPCDGTLVAYNIAEEKASAPAAPVVLCDKCGHKASGDVRWWANRPHVACGGTFREYRPVYGTHNVEDLYARVEEKP